VGRSKADGHSVCDRGMSGAERHAAEQRSPGYLLTRLFHGRDNMISRKYVSLKTVPLLPLPPSVVVL
jgi:hypothetical protein